MVRSEEVVHDSLLVEEHRAEGVPHELTPASLEMMRPSISPHLDGIEALIEMLEGEQVKPHLEHEMIVILIRLRVLTHEVQVLQLTSTSQLVERFEHDDAVLNIDQLILTRESSFTRLQRQSGEVHQHQ